MQHPTANSVYGILTYTGKAVCRNAIKGHWYYEAYCACGKHLWVRRSSLEQQQSCRSCAYKTHGETLSRLYAIWCSMKGRCKDAANPHYGKKGIQICADWFDSYIAFRAWAMTNGYNDSLALGRIDANKNYEPENCRWVSAAENQRNRCRRISCIETGEMFNSVFDVLDFLQSHNKFGSRLTDKAVYRAISDARPIANFTFAWASTTNATIRKV